MSSVEQVWICAGQELRHLSALWSTVTAVSDIGEDPLAKFRRRVFGSYSGGETMPPAFLSQLQHLTDSADAILGIRRSNTERVAYWLKGGVLGFLACTGSYDADADISGWVLRLGDVARLDIDVKVVLDRPGPRGENPGVSGRILKINAHTLDASPNSALPDKLEEIERFIDQLLAVFAG